MTYKDGWEFSAYQGQWEGTHLVIKAVLPDSYTPGKDVTIQVENFLPPMPNSDYLNTWLSHRLARIEVHEMREFFKVDGKAVFDPHAPFAERDLAL